MSEAVTARLDRISLASVQSVFDRLTGVTLARNLQYQPSRGREIALGESISKGLKSFSAGITQLGLQLDSSQRELIATMGRAESLNQALHARENALLGAMVEQKLGAKNQDCLKTLTKARELLSQGELGKLQELKIGPALDALSNASRQAHQELATVERQVLTEKTAEAMTALGYHVQQKQRKEGMLLRGQKQSLSIAAQVDDGGQLAIDMAGFEGGSCQEALKELQQELKKRGIGITLLDRQYHGKKQGSVLAQQAEAEFNPIAQKAPPESVSQKVRNNLARLAHTRIKR